ncbi:transcription regulator [Escherichia coli]|uniref:hypothetical protein n=1 Tax=Escherichia coli TaxID=562 RepID=UPI0010F3ED53|nr:hypothetical protein [Escherichia coli]GCW86140.1 transcription regulator [Escherichia coli]GDE33842.1 transcription regulator [Escherichia coli]GDE88627.1 transcription regulator [Escherichia coli]GDV05624.1 transcription regulator [Escherichia coli]
MFACSVILINSPFETIFAGKKLLLQKNDVLLTDNVSKSLFLYHTDNVTELRIDECIIIKYMENAGRVQYSDTAVSAPFIKTTFTHPFPLRDIILHISQQKALPQQFSEQLFFACLSIFSTHKSFMPLLFKCIKSVALKIRYIIFSMPSRHGELKTSVILCT